MKSSEFIIETEVKPYEHSTLDVKKAVEVLNQYCSESIALIHRPIWRGMENHKKPIKKADPSTGIRKSTNTQNYYTELMSSSPYMQGWPKRNASFICSTNYNKARGFGNWKTGPYAIFPFNGVKIAVCPGNDMWDTPISIPEFGLTFQEGWAPQEFNDLIEHRLALPSSMPAMFAKLQELETKHRVFKQLMPAVRNKVGKSENLSPEFVIDIFQRALAPENTGLKLMSITEFAKSGFDKNEVWIGGPVIALREDMYKAFLDAVQKQGK